MHCMDHIMSALLRIWTECIQDATDYCCKRTFCAGQDKYPCLTAVDQRGEQTVNRDAKTSDGIKYFASDPGATLKWTLNCSTQARNTQARYNLAEIICSEDVYKALRLSHILKSE